MLVEIAHPASTRKLPENGPSAAKFPKNLSTRPSVSLFNRASIAPRIAGRWARVSTSGSLATCLRVSERR